MQLVFTLYNPQGDATYTGLLVCIDVQSKSRDYKERQVDRKKRKVFVTAHVMLRTAAMFLESALNRGSHPPEI